jgi:hypothetical protein
VKATRKFNGQKRITRFRFFLLAVFCGLIFANGYAQNVATLEVELSNANSQLETPVKAELNAITLLSDTPLSLVEVWENKRSPVSFQIEDGEQRALHWVIRSGGKHVFELVKRKPESSPNRVQAKRENGLLAIYAGNKKLLGYQYATVYPPAGVDSAYQRSGFIHPLWSPRGQVLTQIQPPDHFLSFFY